MSYILAPVVDTVGWRPKIEGYTIVGFQQNASRLVKIGLMVQVFSLYYSG
jgi:hypothetical protein